jgi:hypothetical protein
MTELLSSQDAIPNPMRRDFLAGCEKVCAGAAESQSGPIVFAAFREVDERTLPTMPVRQGREILPTDKSASRRARI